MKHANFISYPAMVFISIVAVVGHASTVQAVSPATVSPATTPTQAAAQALAQTTSTPPVLISQTSALSFGAQGAAVRELQDNLAELGYFNAISTGYFGTETERAVRRFQVDYGIESDGRVGTSTAATIDRVIVDRRPTSDTSAASLKQGDSGTRVSNLQQQLRQLGFDVPVTGFFGETTEAAILTLQRRNNLVVDGIVGPSTVAVLTSGGNSGNSGNSSNSGGIGGPTPYGSRLLRQGDSGEDVELLQRLLRTRRLYLGPVTGTFDAATEQAVILFQQQFSLTVDGIVGNEVYQRL